MKWFLLALVAFGLILNPSREEHIQKAAAEYKLHNPLKTGLLGLDKAATAKISRQNFLLFSLGSLDNKIVTVGLFGGVWIIDNEPLK
jgi:hypothetical protein